ncbi:hypothetical protein MRX96_018594 [Rhipicephalus microplus]
MTMQMRPTDRYLSTRWCSSFIVTPTAPECSSKTGLVEALLAQPAAPKMLKPSNSVSIVVRSTARALTFSYRAWMNTKLGLEDSAGLLPMDAEKLRLHLGSNTRRRSSSLGTAHMVPASRPTFGRTRIACRPPYSRPIHSWLAGRRRSLFGTPRSVRR